MKEKEHKIICKSFILRSLFSVITALGFVILSYLDYIFLGIGVTFILALPLSYILSVKMFPDSSEFYSHEHKFFLRSRKGLKPDEECSPIKGHYYDDFMRG